MTKGTRRNQELARRRQCEARDFFAVQAAENERLTKQHEFDANQAARRAASPDTEFSAYLATAPACNEMGRASND